MISSKEIGFELEVHLYKFPLWLKENIEYRENQEIVLKLCM